MKTAISLPDKLFNDAEREAKRRGVTRSKLVQTALEKLIKHQSDDTITKRLNESIAKYGDPSDDEFVWIEHSQTAALGPEKKKTGKAQKR